MYMPPGLQYLLLTQVVIHGSTFRIYDKGRINLTCLTFIEMVQEVIGCQSTGCV
jgi:hypothetical protein